VFEFSFVNVLDEILTSLVEVLDEKGILTQEEWKNRIKSKIEKINSL